MSYAKIELDYGVLRNLDKAAIRALHQTAEVLHGDIKDAMVIPRDIGTLGDTAFYVDESHLTEGTVSLVNDTKYARRLYYHPEYNFHQEYWEDEKGTHDGNPNAKGKWFEDWEYGGEKGHFASEAFEKFFKREAGL